MQEGPNARPDDPDLTALRAGGDILGAEVLTRFSERLAGLVRSRLGWKLRRKLDAEDVVQSVLMSFVRLQREKGVSFENWEALWGLLALITVRKCGHKIEHFMAACRRVSAEHSVIVAADGFDDESRGCIDALSREPDPLHAAVGAETIENLLADLDDRDRRIVTLALEGATLAEISEEVRRSERTVQRVLKRVWEHLASQAG